MIKPQSLYARTTYASVSTPFVQVVCIHSRCVERIHWIFPRSQYNGESAVWSMLHLMAVILRVCSWGPQISSFLHNYISHTSPGFFICSLICVLVMIFLILRSMLAKFSLVLSQCLHHTAPPPRHWFLKPNCHHLAWSSITFSHGRYTLRGSWSSSYHSGSSHLTFLLVSTVLYFLHCRAIWNYILFSVYHFTLSQFDHIYPSQRTSKCPQKTFLCVRQILQLAFIGCGGVQSIGQVREKAGAAGTERIFFRNTFMITLFEKLDKKSQ